MSHDGFPLSIGFAPTRQVVKLLGSNVQVVHKELLVLLQDDALEVESTLSRSCLHVLKKS